MEFDLDNTIALLARTPATFDALLRGLPEALTLANEGVSTWNAREVVAHLLYADRVNWMARAKMILDYGDTRPFEAFDRQGHVRASEGKSLAAILDEFAEVRAANLAELRALNLGAEQLARRGAHPALGTVTLSQLLAAWSTHDLTHLHQVSRILAHRSRKAVGSWSKFLGVLQCGGHSTPA